MIEIVLKILILVKRFIPINKKYSYLIMKDIISLSKTNLKINNILNNFYKFRLSNEYSFTKQFKITNYIITFDKLIKNKIPSKILNLIDINEELTEDSTLISINNSNFNFYICYDNKIEFDFRILNHDDFRPWKSGDQWGLVKHGWRISLSKKGFKKLLLENGWYFISLKKLNDLLEENLQLSNLKNIDKIHSIFENQFKKIKEEYLDLLIEDAIDIRYFEYDEIVYYDEVKDNKIIIDETFYNFIKRLMKFVDKKCTYRNFISCLDFFEGLILDF